MRAAGRPGVAFVVPGVGVYNSGAGMATAYATSSPVLQIAGQVVRDTIGRAMGSLHEVHEQLDVVRPVTKWQTRALRAVEIPAALHEAFRQMATGRPRPTHVEVPPEGFAESAEITLIDREHYPRRGRRPRSDPRRGATAGQSRAAVDRRRRRCRAR